MSTPLPERRCDLCDHYEATPPKNGLCLRYPQAVGKRPSSRCGEFSPAPNAPGVETKQ